MRLRKSKDNQLEFRKKCEKEIHDFNFKRFISFVISQVKIQADEEVSDNDISDAEGFVSDQVDDDISEISQSESDEQRQIEDEIQKIKEKQSNQAKEFLEDTLQIV